MCLTHAYARRRPRRPCAGKSTALSHIRDRLRRLGLHVVTVPENASLVFQNSGGYDAAWVRTATRMERTSVDTKRPLLREGLLLAATGQQPAAINRELSRVCSRTRPLLAA